MKAYTNIEQSKKLAEILPIESADMHYATWTILDGEFIVSPNQGSTIESLQEDFGNQIIPCWSLAALLNVLPKKYYPIKGHETNLILGKPKDKWCVLYWDTTGMQDGEQTLGNNPVDACYEMIMKLHEQKLL